MLIIKIILTKIKNIIVIITIITIILVLKRFKTNFEKWCQAILERNLRIVLVARHLNIKKNLNKHFQFSQLRLIIKLLL